MASLARESSGAFTSAGPSTAQTTAALCLGGAAVLVEPNAR